MNLTLIYFQNLNYLIMKLFFLTWKLKCLFLFRCLQISAEMGHIFPLKLALNKEPRDEKGWTPLHSAAKFDQREILKFLLKHVTDVQPKNNNNDTPLHIASEFGHIECIKILLTEFCTNIDSKNSADATPLNLAVQNGYTDIAKFLLSRGAKLDKNLENLTTPSNSSGSLKWSSIFKLKNFKKKKILPEFRLKNAHTLQHNRSNSYRSYFGRRNIEKKVDSHEKLVNQNPQESKLKKFNLKNKLKKFTSHSKLLHKEYKSNLSLQEQNFKSVGNLVVDKFVNNETYSGQRGISLLSVYYPEMEDQNIIVEENLNMENGKNYTVSQEFPDSVKNMLLLKNPQFLSDHYKTLPK